jgi:O-acetyl-ADP-ribose deacetylase
VGMLIHRVEMPAGQELVLRQGDLTLEDVDAIVNAANRFLQHGGGVAGAIVRRGGLGIQAESSQLSPVEVGSAVLTGAGDLKARHVIHAVGPQWGEGNEVAKLASAGRAAMAIAEEQGLTSIALPAISSGIFGFPKDRCAKILVDAAVTFCEEHPNSRLREIRFTLIDDETVKIFKSEFERRWGGAPGSA